MPHRVVDAGTGGRLGKMDPAFEKCFDDDMLEAEYGGTLPT